jgi:hypothetical protein
MNITYRYTPANSEMGREEVLHSDINCERERFFKERFSKDDYVFGKNENTTFFVYVYEFEPPLGIIISFSTAKQSKTLSPIAFFFGLVIALQRWIDG